jgi:hypothetical protein
VLRRLEKLDFTLKKPPKKGVILETKLLFFTEKSAK